MAGGGCGRAAPAPPAGTRRERVGGGRPQRRRPLPQLSAPRRGARLDARLGRRAQSARAGVRRGQPRELSAHRRAPAPRQPPASACSSQEQWAARGRGHCRRGRVPPARAGRARGRPSARWRLACRRPASWRASPTRISTSIRSGACCSSLEAVRTTRAVDGTVVREAEEALQNAVTAVRPGTPFNGRAGNQIAASPDGSRYVARDISGRPALTASRASGERTTASAC